MKVGCRAASIVDELITVGERARDIARGAELCGFERAHVREAGDCASAIPILQAILQPQDVILVKGSRGMKMEQIVAAMSKEAL